LETGENMIGKIFTMLTETNIHVGGGRSASAVDLPFFRETITDYPAIPSSSLKGALRSAGRDLLNEKIKKDDLDLIFGKSDSIGSLSISDARLLLLPVRSLTTNYKWITCNYVLERFIRDILRTLNKELWKSAKELFDSFQQLDVEEGKFLGNTKENICFLEELEFSKMENSSIDQNLINLIMEYIPLSGKIGMTSRFENQFVILHDNDFKWFANYGLNVVTRNVLEVDTKMSKNIWYEESIPTDTLFYSVLLSENKKTNDKFAEIVKDNYIQIGGNESIGQGWVNVKIFGDEK
jgi:CRISPR-associated protein Cmr4